jgi:hypothetical protein
MEYAGSRYAGSAEKIMKAFWAELNWWMLTRK